ncbi:hypothetical protein HPP92_013229 [Vanilla planifolia]|uniref:Uncharacterized protein n=1 Tax=Vanilla planifolia TaxID=51239 RepID=A0A835QXS2_VANPL|nr:hypothetical protein HPP92_013229 [Vanilla planifolia]
MMTATRRDKRRYHVIAKSQPARAWPPFHPAHGGAGSDEPAGRTSPAASSQPWRPRRMPPAARPLGAWLLPDTPPSLDRPQTREHIASTSSSDATGATTLQPAAPLRRVQTIHTDHALITITAAGERINHSADSGRAIWQKRSLVDEPRYLTGSPGIEITEHLRRHAMAHSRPGFGEPR